MSELADIRLRAKVLEAEAMDAKCQLDGLNKQRLDQGECVNSLTSGIASGDKEIKGLERETIKMKKLVESTKKRASRAKESALLAGKKRKGEAQSWHAAKKKTNNKCFECSAE